jgi:branched-chain amino acid transport system permease protein
MAVSAPALAGPLQYLEAQARWRPIEVLFWLATLLPFVLTPNYLVLASQIAVTALFAMSLDLILGYAGIVSLGHAAFFGIGAYTAGLITIPHTISITLKLWHFSLPITITQSAWGEPITGLVISGFMAGLVGYATSFIIARFRHLALIMITLGFGLLLEEAANSANGLTGGADGLQGVHMWPLFNTFHFDLYGYTAYWYALIALFLCLLLARRLINSPFGLSLRGIRENIVRMRAIGAESRPHIRTIFTIAAVMAGVAGAILTQSTETVSLGSLDFQRSADILVILILGGTGRLYGGLIGAVIYLIARDQFSGINPQYWYFPIGILLILVVLFLPNGILGGLSELVNTERGQRWFGWLTSSSSWRRSAP